jgi:hypothetical protein
MQCIRDGQFIDGLMSNGGTYSRGSSILTYIVIKTIIEIELLPRKGVGHIVGEGTYDVVLHYYSLVL